MCSRHGAVFCGGAIKSDCRAVWRLSFGSIFTHRLVKWTPPLRNAVADWESWTRKDFPMGLALTSTIMIYLLLRIWPLFVPVSV